MSNFDVGLAIHAEIVGLIERIRGIRDVAPAIVLPGCDEGGWPLRPS